MAFSFLGLPVEILDRAVLLRRKHPVHLMGQLVQNGVVLIHDRPFDVLYTRDRVVSAAPAKPVEEIALEPEEDKKTNKWLWIGLGVLAVAAAAGGGGGGGGGGSTVTVSGDLP